MVMLSGVCIGSLQYILPAIIHIRHQPPLQYGDGCIVCICVCVELHCLISV